MRRPRSGAERGQAPDESQDAGQLVCASQSTTIAIAYKDKLAPKINAPQVQVATPPPPPPPVCVGEPNANCGACKHDTDNSNNKLPPVRLPCREPPVAGQIQSPSANSGPSGCWANPRISTRDNNKTTLATNNDLPESVANQHYSTRGKLISHILESHSCQLAVSETSTNSCNCQFKLKAVLSTSQVSQLQIKRTNQPKHIEIITQQQQHQKPMRFEELASSEHQAEDSFHQLDATTKVFVNLDDASKCIIRESPSPDISDTSSDSFTVNRKRKRSLHDTVVTTKSTNNNAKLNINPITSFNRNKSQCLSIKGTCVNQEFSPIGNECHNSIEETIKVKSLDAKEMATVLTATVEPIHDQTELTDLDNPMTDQQLLTLTRYGSDIEDCATNSTDDDDNDEDNINGTRQHRHNNSSTGRHQSNSKRNQFTNANNIAPPIKLTEIQLEQLKELIEAIREDNFQDFIGLLERKEFKSSLLNVFIDGQTALHYSLLYGRSLAWCKQLVTNGANPNLTNRAGWHPIHLAAFICSRETMRYLIDQIEPM